MKNSGFEENSRDQNSHIQQDDPNNANDITSFEVNNETGNIRDNDLTPFNLESNSLTSITGDEIPTSSFQVKHQSITKRKKINIAMRIEKMKKNKLTTIIQGQGDTGANTSATNRLDIIHNYIKYDTPEKVSVFIDDEETETILEAEGIGQLHFVSDQGNIMKWDVVYTPKSGGTVLSPDNYHRTNQSKIYSFYQSGNSDNIGSMGFLCRNNQLIDSLSLHRNKDGQWMAINQILLPDACDNIHLIRQITTKRVNQIIQQEEENAIKKKNKEESINIETKTWSSNLHHFLNQQEKSPAPKNIQNLELWHQRMGHISPQTLEQTRKCTNGIPPIPTKTPMFKCPFCEKAKMLKRSGKQKEEDSYIPN